MKKVFLATVFSFLVLIVAFVSIKMDGNTFLVKASTEKKVKLNVSKKKLKVGQKFQLKVENLPANYSLVWRVSDVNTISVNTKGEVMAKKTGKAVITITINDSTTLSCKITVVSNKKKLKKTPKEKDIYKKISKLKKEFKENSLWGDEKEYFCEANNTLGFGCAALGFKVSDLLFGKDAPMKKKTDFSDIKNQIRIGDLIRVLNNSHTVIVVDKEEDGVILLEGNFYLNHSKEGRIHWGEKLTFQELMDSANYYITRYGD